MEDLMVVSLCLLMGQVRCFQSWMKTPARPVIFLGNMKVCLDPPYFLMHFLRKRRDF